MIAEALADSGQDMREVVKVPIKPTMENVKANLFDVVMTAMYPDITSTTDLEPHQLQELYEAFNAATSERLGVGFPFPSEDEL